jgi:hypothetical protein
MRRPTREPGRTARLRAPAALAVAVAVALVPALAGLAGCGGNSKPDYCSDRTDLENSIKGVTSAATSGDVNALKTQVAAIESDARTLVDSARSDFPSETAAIRTSVQSLQSAVTALPSSPSAAQVATVGSDAAAVVNSVTGFVNASKSKCS